MNKQKVRLVTYGFERNKRIDFKGNFITIIK